MFGGSFGDDLREILTPAKFRRDVLRAGRSQVEKCGVDTHGECAEREPITEVWGQTAEPPAGTRGPGTEPLVRG